MANERREVQRLGEENRRLELRELRGSRVQGLARKLGRVMDKVVPKSGRK